MARTRSRSEPCHRLTSRAARRERGGGGVAIDDSGFYNLTVFYVYWDKEERQGSFLGFDSAYSMMRGPATLRCR